MMNLLVNRWIRFGLVVAAITAIVASERTLLGADAPQSASKGGGEYKLLQGAIDVHFHIDPDTETRGVDAADIAKMKFARAQGLRGAVIKNHYETTGSVAYLIRKEIPGFEAFASVVMNFNQGGINPAVVEYLANGIKGHPGRIVWMPTYDSENAVKRSNQPNRPFVAIVKNGQVVAEAKEVIRLIAKYDLTLATGHLSPDQGLLVLQEGRRQGVKHMIVTHPMDAGVFATEAQMKEAAKLGAYLEFDFRNILTGKIEYPFKTEPVDGGRIEMIRKLGPANVIIDEFWSKSNKEPREYGGPQELAMWVTAMNAHGFTNRELDVMCKENPAKLLGLPLKSTSND